ncbi:DUF896 domain-containing protein [Youxingia wuxianensis]|uniref:UPF0291 protein H8705_12700 n=1 Tax=Youxingia wuxianensis TaxID=2763678 RepID=A0A926IIK1_9FIRM|nr:DUF896 domain-containing protein [Youxingia wuxianensis]MBC8586441.1 DUF896 domain-containing protein [Youxingia wuxianensis]
MDQKKIQRINELAKKERETGLTDVEKEERLALRQEYIADMKANLTATLENTYLVDEKGNKTKLQKKE